MRDNARAMVLASFVADCLALGVHWIYDARKIASEYGRVEDYLKPGKNSYHPSRDKGEFTHYGDQQLVLLESVAAQKGFHLNDFSNRWQSLFQDYDGYYDSATKATLRNFSKGRGPENSGSPSNDLAGASRIAPLVFCYRHDIDALVKASKAQTRMTHTDPLTVHVSDFFARVALKTLQGTSPVEAIRQVSEERFPGSPIAEWVEEGLDSVRMDSVEAVGHFGQSCHTPEAFPGVIHLIAKYENDLKEALVQAVMAGGDNAARGMAVGMVLGAHLGESSFPYSWISGLKKEREIKTLLQELE